MNFQKFALPEVVIFLQKHIHTDLPEFLLKKSPFDTITIQELAQQLKGRRIAEKKFPFLLKDEIVFPPHLNLEQSSSTATAKYKGQNLKGEKFLDLTAGFGIDAYFLSQNFKEVTLVERDKELLQIVAHNWGVLSKNANFISGSLLPFIENTTEKFDVIYLDPARRSTEKRKVFLLEDLSPNILEIQDQLLALGNIIMTKLSPLIDLSYLVSVVHNLFKIEIIAVKNEVKEVLIHQKYGLQNESIEIECVNLETDEESFHYQMGEEKSALPKYGDFLNYLYIPNSAVLKSGAFNLVSQNFNLKKLHPNTQLFTSEKLIESFPGRILKMKLVASKEIKKGEQWNIISKNYPLSVEEIQKKYKLKQGGKRYLIFTKSRSGKIILESI